MCGLAGFITRKSGSRPDLDRVLQRMTDQIKHRGPDDQGHWSNAAAGAYLGHRRLAIMDLSPLGHQPMHSTCSRYVIVFNGEVYNFHDIRKELATAAPHITYRGHSDTEVMLAAFATWGVEPSLKRFNGMYAFALWDKAERVLHLGRDRLGKKPLYYGWMGDTFLFGSELKSFWAHPEWKGEIDTDALHMYFQYKYIPAPYSIFQNIHKLSPGAYLTLKPSDIANRQTPPETLYWDHAQTALHHIRNPRKESYQEASKQLETLLLDAVKIRMESDVPLGSFLSGGIDSSIVTALMQAQSKTPVHTYSIGFNESSYNEAEHAKAVAAHLGTDHTELYVNSQDALDSIPLIPEIYDEPFADSSQIPTYLVSKLARAYVTVALSGDGGDEFFYGYSRYEKARNAFAKINQAPAVTRPVMGAALRGAKALGRAVSKGKSKLAGMATQMSERAASLQHALAYQNPTDFYARSLDLKLNHAKIQGAFPAINKTAFSRLAGKPFDQLSFTDIMMLTDALTYLPDDILVKVDRASMASSLEGRAPLLDYRVAEFAWGLPFEYKFAPGNGKRILKDILYKYVPKPLLDRPKAGFGVPLDTWLRGPLKSWMMDTLDNPSTKNDSLVDPKLCAVYVKDHLDGRRNHRDRIWTLLVFRQWMSHYKSKLASLTASA